MALYIEISEGDEAGSRHRIGHGFRIGRSTGELLLNDPKVSNLHAQVEKDGRGQLILVDMESSNGLRINGQKVKRIAMLPGVSFQVGKTLFKVVQLFGQDPAQNQKEEETRGWRDTLKSLVPKLQASNRTMASPVLPFAKPVKLLFKEGVQADQEIVLGFGPRKLGSDTLDIELQEYSAPPVAFEISPDAEGARFTTAHPKLVLLNQNPISSDILKGGDVIQCGESLIEVSFLE